MRKGMAMVRTFSIHRQILNNVNADHHVSWRVLKKARGALSRSPEYESARLAKSMSMFRWRKLKDLAHSVALFEVVHDIHT